jgi:adenylyltransferase/sulfurtransferase
MQETARTPGSARFSRQRALPGFGIRSQTALSESRVLVIGAGGLGSAVIPALAAAGIGTIGIIDGDTVEESNLHRQLIHGAADIGRTKVDSAAATIAALSPDTTVETFGFALDSANALEIARRFDLIVDGSDNFPTRYLASDAAELLGTPIVWGAVSQYGGQASSSLPGHTPTYRDLFPVPPRPGAVVSCEVGGVLPTVCATIGAIMATEVIKIITGIGTPLFGRVTTFDALSGEFRELEFARDPHASVITELIDYELFCGTAARGENISALELAESVDAVQVIDVREPWEAAIATIPGAVLVPLGSLKGAASRGIDGIDPRKPTVVFCHHGIRSAQGVGILRELGFTNVRHLEGGIDAWALTADPQLARY